MGGAPWQCRALCAPSSYPIDFHLTVVPPCKLPAEPVQHRPALPPCCPQV